MDLYGFEEEAPPTSSVGSATGSRLGLLRKAGGGNAAGRGLKFQAKAIARKAEADAVLSSFDAEPSAPRDVPSSSRGRGAPYRGRGTDRRAGQRNQFDRGSADKPSEASIPQASSSSGSIVAKPSMATRTKEETTQPSNAAEAQVTHVQEAEEVVALGVDAEADEIAADELPEEDVNWPPRIDSEHRPITLPYRLGAPVTANQHKSSKAADAFATVVRGEAPSTRKRVYAGSNVVSAAGYGVTSAVVQVDATPQQCAHHFVDTDRLVRHAEIEAAGDVDMDWPPESDYVPLAEHNLLHFILPATLPCRGHYERRTKIGAEEDSEDPSSAYRAKMREVPSGPIGQLAILKSGQVKLKIGDLLYDVTAGLPRSMYEQIVAITSEDTAATTPKQYVELGQVAATLTVTPNIDSMLHTMKTEKKEASSMYAALARDVAARSKPHRQRAGSHSSAVEVGDTAAAKG